MPRRKGRFAAWRPCPPSEFAVFGWSEVQKMRFLWPFWIPLAEKPHKMRGKHYFSTAGKYKMHFIARKIRRFNLQEDSWLQV
jgi:hypothetical protein